MLMLFRKDAAALAVAAATAAGLLTLPAGAARGDAAVVLSAKPAAGATFAGWSTPDCQGTGDCRLTLDDDQSVAALFSKLTLSVDTSGAKPGDLVTSSPAGISCPDTCSADFDARATVRLMVKTAAGSTLTSFPYSCTSVDGATCT